MAQIGGEVRAVARGYDALVESWVKQIQALEKENTRILGLLAAERDRFGKMKIEMMAENQRLKTAWEAVAKEYLPYTKKNWEELESKLARYREALKDIAKGEGLKPSGMSVQPTAYSRDRLRLKAQEALADSGKEGE
jgi:hypothetical protein